MQLPDFLTEDPDGFIHVTGHRIGLQHLVFYYNEGYSPEMLFCEYPTLTLATIHKVIAFYLENQKVVDEYIAQCQREIDAQRAATPRGPGLAELRQRLAKMKQLQGG
jgi:uncharacterized protein (DUF433 family)